ncbi:MAG: hypothetical protein Q9200_006778 [Gallowayella weberi]
MNRPPKRSSWHNSTQQQVLLEYANLRQHCPEGIYLSLTPGRLTQWSGILFVRKGPYAPAVLRFVVSFPPGYPALPPVITFVTDIFHPLVTPLTSYTYSSGSSGSDTTRVTDMEHLAPGGYALSHAFPYWFESRESSSSPSENFSRKISISYTKDESSEDDKLPSSKLASKSSSDCRPPPAPIAAILEYIKTTFDDEDILDGLPAEAAVNPGAWKAWHAHRRDVSPQAKFEKGPNDQSNTIPGKHQSQVLTGSVKHPKEWSWDGVWERRVRNGIDASISEQILFGAGGGDEIVHFSPIQDDAVDELKEMISNIARMESDIVVSSLSKKLTANLDLTPQPLFINKRKRQATGQSPTAHASWPTGSLVPAAKVRRAATMSYPPTFMRPQPMRSQSAHDQHEVAHPSQSTRAVTLATIPWSDASHHVAPRDSSSSSYDAPRSSTSDESDRTLNLDCIPDSNSEYTVRRKQPLKHRILSRVMNSLIGKPISSRSLVNEHGTRKHSTEESTTDESIRDECPGTTTDGRPSFPTTEGSSSIGTNLETALPECLGPPVSTFASSLLVSDSLSIEQQPTVQQYRRLCVPGGISIIQPKISIVPETEEVNANRDRSLYVAVEITAVAETVRGLHGLDVAVIIDNS